ncbi:hypothetical protein [Shimia sp.]|uniref:hypothetical protein n=1 Tax=Shimia sp. TaxID=1954381 RepID=UPI003BAD504C
MKVYDITQNTDRPWLAFVGIPGVLPFVMAEEAGHAVLVRAVYDGFSTISALFAVPMADGGHELFLFSREGMTKVTAFNSEHHHVSIISANPQAYAKALNTEYFFARSTVQREGFFEGRFEGWVEFDAGGTRWAGLEVTE